MSRRKLGRAGIFIAGLLGMFAISAGSAIAAGPPIVTIGATTNPSLNTRTINGTVDKNGASNVTYKVEYGKTKLYGSSTSSITATGSGAIPISQVVAGLEPLTTYHARISATNSFGTNVSEDVPFEMLLQWKVAGKPLSAWPGRRVWQDWHPGVKTLNAEGTTKGGTQVKITCEDGTTGANQTWGELGIFYRFPYKNCKTFLNGTESKACKPPDFNLELNSVFVPVAGSKFQLGLECSIGEEIPLTTSGFEVGAMSEALEQSFNLTEQLPFAGMKVTLGNNTWTLTGDTLGQKFGIS